MEGRRSALRDVHVLLAGLDSGAPAPALPMAASALPMAASTAAVLFSIDSLGYLARVNFAAHGPASGGAQGFLNRYWQVGWVGHSFCSLLLLCFIHMLYFAFTHTHLHTHAVAHDRGAGSGPGVEVHHLSQAVCAQSLCRENDYRLGCPHPFWTVGVVSLVGY